MTPRNAMRFLTSSTTDADDKPIDGESKFPPIETRA